MNRVKRIAYHIAHEVGIADVREVLALPFSQIREWMEVLEDEARMMNEAIGGTNPTGRRTASPRRGKNWVTDPRMLEQHFKNLYGKK